MKHILFLCAGNTCRSPMAEGIFSAMLAQKGGEYTAQSAGLCAAEGAPAADNAIAACREIGVDITHHRSRSFSLSLTEGDVIAVPLTHTYAAALLGAVPQSKLYIPKESIADPYGGDLECYRRCRDELISLCEKLYEELEPNG